MKIGINITILGITALICITVVCVVAVASGFNGALLTGAMASLVAIPTGIITKLVVEKKAKKE